MKKKKKFLIGKCRTFEQNIFERKLPRKSYWKTFIILFDLFSFHALILLPIIIITKTTNALSSKCCYGLSMDLLENIAEELGFEFHLYIVRDELFGAKFNNLKDWTIKNKNKQAKQQQQFDNDQHNKSKEQHKKAYENIKTQYEPNFGGNNG
jgi:hypothetical protein